MIIDNENKKLSRSRRRRIERRNKIDDNTKLTFNKIGTEKKKKIKFFEKIENIKILLVKIEYASNPEKLQSALKELNKIQVVDKISHEIGNEILGDFDGEFEMIGSSVFGDKIPQTHIRFRNNADYESYINAIDQDYESDDAIFDGYVYKINTSLFNIVNRSQYHILSKSAGKYNRDLTPYELDKCKKKIQLQLMEIIVLVTL